ncbi:peptidyl-prolyl cis-trans isomerase [Eubacteriales bacterium OttesenSCG-928-K08]|nr:peptidyl-prolyl cis-trans isomerase [Eubacteriales bacterium OttesenSCG-928-K08]
MKKRYLAAVVAVFIAFSMIGCDIKSDTPSPSSSPTPPQAEDVVIARVRDVELYKSKFQSVFRIYFNNYAGYGADFSDEELLKSFQNWMFDTFVQNEVLYQQTQIAGLTLTPEEEAEYRQIAQDRYDEYVEYYTSLAEEAGIEDPATAAVERLLEDLALDNLDEEGFKENYYDELRRVRLQEKLREQVVADVTVSEAVTLSSFKSDVQFYRDRYAENPGSYRTDVSAGNDYNLPPLFVPEGYRRVKHILVDDEQLAISLKARLDAGEDFDKLMEEYGTDNGIKSEPNKSEGYLMDKNTNFVPEFLEAALALENIGDLTEPVKSEHGYHIIKLVDIIESRELTYEEVKENYDIMILETMQEEHYKSQIELWKEDAQIVSYIGRIRDMGVGGTFD